MDAIILSLSKEKGVCAWEAGHEQRNEHEAQSGYTVGPRRFRLRTRSS